MIFTSVFYIEFFAFFILFEKDLSITSRIAYDPIIYLMFYCLQVTISSIIIKLYDKYIEYKIHYYLSSIITLLSVYDGDQNRGKINQWICIILLILCF